MPYFLHLPFKISRSATAYCTTVTDSPTSPWSHFSTSHEYVKCVVNDSLLPRSFPGEGKEPGMHCICTIAPEFQGDRILLINNVTLQQYMNVVELDGILP